MGKVLAERELNKLLKQGYETITIHQVLLWLRQK